MKRNNTAEQLNPEAYREIAGQGFTVALRQLGAKLNRQKDGGSVAFIAKKLGRDEIQIRFYQKSGLPDHLVVNVLDILRKRGVSFGAHQLKPTLAIVKAHLAQVESAKRSGQGA